MNDSSDYYVLKSIEEINEKMKKIDLVKNRENANINSRDNVLHQNDYNSVTFQTMSNHLFHIDFLHSVQKMRK